LVGRQITKESAGDLVTPGRRNSTRATYIWILAGRGKGSVKSRGVERSLQEEAESEGVRPGSARRGVRRIHVKITYDPGLNGRGEREK